MGFESFLVAPSSSSSSSSSIGGDQDRSLTSSSTSSSGSSSGGSIYFSSSSSFSSPVSFFSVVEYGTSDKPSKTVIQYGEGDETPTTIVDYGVAKLAAEKEPDEIPLLAQQLQSYGANVLSTANGDPIRTSMARRLTEIDPQTMQTNAQLPFCRKKNKCLQGVYEARKVSSECADSIRALETTTTVVVNKEKDRVLEADQQGRTDESSVSKLMWVYFAIFAVYSISMLVLPLVIKDKEETEYELSEDEDDDDAVYYALQDETKPIKPTMNVAYEGIPVTIV